jgi:superfamily II DNA helicase RecQ
MMPLSLRDYVQETGRGGRDFQQANCTLFFSFYDKKKAKDVVGLSGERCRRLQGDERVRAEADLNNVVNYAMAGDACRYSLLAEGVTIEEADPIAQSCEDDTSCDNCRAKKGKACTSLSNPVWTICSETGDKISEVCFCKKNATDVIRACLSKGLAKSQQFTAEAQVERCFRETVIERFHIESDEKEKFFLLNFLNQFERKSLLLELVRYLPKQQSEDGKITRTDWGKVQSFLELISSGKIQFFVQSARVPKLKDTLPSKVLDVEVADRRNVTFRDNMDREQAIPLRSPPSSDPQGVPDGWCRSGWIYSLPFLIQFELCRYVISQYGQSLNRCAF